MSLNTIVTKKTKRKYGLKLQNNLTSVKSNGATHTTQLLLENISKNNLNTQILIKMFGICL